MLNWIRPDNWESFWYGFVMFPIVAVVVLAVVVVVCLLREWRQDINKNNSQITQV